MSKRRNEAGASSSIGFPSSSVATLGLWAYLIVFGGGCLALYYQRIHYIPELHWEDALSELFVLSILGGCVWILFGLLLFLPGAIWSRELIWDNTLRDVLCFNGDEKAREPCLSSIWRSVGMPFAVYMGCAHLGLILGRIWLCVACPVGFVLALWLCLREMRADLGYPRTHPKRWPWLLTAWRDPDASPQLAAGYATAGDTQAVELTEATGAPAGQEPTVDKTAPPHSRLSKYLFWFGISMALGSMSLLIDFALSGRQSMRDWKLALICTAVIICANLGVALRFKSHPPSAVGISVVAGLALLVVGEAIEDRNSMLCRTMEAFGVGDDTKVSFTVKAGYRDVLCGLQIPFHQVGGPQGALVIRNAAMLSRLGVNYFARAGDRQFQLPKTEVLSWSAMTDSTVALRRRHRDADIAIQSGRVFADKIVFANEAAEVTTDNSQVQLLARWESDVMPELVHLEVCGDQRCLYLAPASGNEELQPALDSCVSGAGKPPATATAATTATAAATATAETANLYSAGFPIKREVVPCKAVWNGHLGAWQVASIGGLAPGEYGLWNPRSGDFAAFAVGAP